MRSMEQRQREYIVKNDAWRKEMRDQGAAATQHDDGWINQHPDWLHLCEPHIRGIIEPGAIIAIGDHEKHRFVRLLGFKKWVLSTDPTWGDWTYEKVTSPSLSYPQATS